jgi:regulator of protease activity HflC (stomatin/prohibitin superfamily)
MDRLNERIAAAAAGLALILGVLDLAAGTVTGLRMLTAIAPLSFLAAAIAALVAARFHLERRAFEERQDAVLARVERPDAALFVSDVEEGDPLSMARARAQFEAVVVRAAAPVLALAQGWAAWWLYRTLTARVAPAASGRLGAAALLAMQAFLLFLAGRYLIGLARDPARRLLRGPGALLGLGALAALFGAAAGIAGHAGWTAADRAVAFVFAGALALLSVESLLGFIGDLYRPRRRDEAPRTGYESRLARLVVEPTGWIGDAAKSLDYQFGFKVSETWFYRFLRGAVAPLLLFQVLILYALSSVVVLAPHEEAVIERLGVPRAESAGGWRLTPGIHWKWPWPFETIRRFPARRLQTIYVGFRHDETRDRPTTLLWTRPHYAEEDTFLLASAEAAAQPSAPGAPGEQEAAAPVNLMSFNIPIEYRIADLRRYAYGFSDPGAVLERLAYRTLTRALAARDILQVLGPERMETAHAVRTALQAEADRLGLGVEIAFVGLHGVHPPVPVAEAFEDVVGALEQREARILEARAYRHRRLPVAEAEARRVVFEAEAYRTRRTLTAEAEAQQFVQRKLAADQAPTVFRNWYYLQTIREALRDVRAYIVAADPAAEVVQFNFEEATPSSLLDMSPLMEKR